MATRKQDVGLLFGMEGGGALSGKTGKLIQDQLTELVKKLNEDKRVAKRGLVFSLNIAETRRRLKLDLTNLLTELNSKKDISKGLKITISEFNAKPALKKLQEQVASVLEGKIVRSKTARLIRNGEEIFKGEIDQLKRFKDDVKEVAQGFECGISFVKFNDIEEGDIVKFTTTKAVDRTEL